MTGLGVRIKQLSNAYEQESNRLLKKHGVTYAQSQILRLVVIAYRKDQPVNQKALEVALKLKNPTVTGTLNRLEAKELITRVTDPQDGRSNLIYPTEKALVQHVESAAAFRKREEKLLAGITKQEQKILLQLLDRVLRNLERSKGKVRERID